MKHILLFESWMKSSNIKIFNTREEYENAILNYLATNGYYEIDNSGQIFKNEFFEYDEENDRMYLPDWAENDAYIGSIENDKVTIGDITFVLDLDYLSSYEWAKKFEDYLESKDIDDTHIHIAQTGTVYVTFSKNDTEYKVRFADHSDAYGTSDFNFATEGSNQDGGNWEDIIKWVDLLP